MTLLLFSQTEAAGAQQLQKLPEEASRPASPTWFSSGELGILVFRIRGVFAALELSEGRRSARQVYGCFFHGICPSVDLIPLKWDLPLMLTALKRDYSRAVGIKGKLPNL